MPLWKRNSSNKASDSDVIITNVSRIFSFRDQKKTGRSDELPENIVSNDIKENSIVNEYKKCDDPNYNDEQIIRQKYFPSSSLDEAETIINKAEERYMPAEIKSLKRHIQETKLKIQQENDERRRQNFESLRSEEKEAFNYIEKAKVAIVNRDLVTTDKYLRDALDLITVPSENFINAQPKVQNNETNEESNDKRHHTYNVLERVMRTEAFKFIKEAEQAFFNFNFDEAEKLLLISKRLSPDEYVEEMIALVENAKQEGISKERIENLRITFFEQLDDEQDSELIDLEFAKTFTITDGFDDAQELLKTMENLYTNKKAKEFFRRIRIATELQRPSNFCINETKNESNIDEADTCLSKAKGAFHVGNSDHTVTQSYVFLNRSQFINSVKKKENLNKKSNK